MPYGLISDTHAHNFSAFSKVNADGVSSRLQIIMDSIWQAAEETKRAGGSTLYHAGDFFHVRGEVAPTVLNPVRALMKRITQELKLNVVLLAGNHDLTGRHADALGNAARALEDCGVQVVDEKVKLFIEPEALVAMFAWEPEPAALLERMRKVVEKLNSNADHPNYAKEFDAIIHAPVNGVIKGIPDHGLEAGELASLGFKRVFSGHYHNNKAFDGNVYSIGASTHQTWSDVDSKAGFLIVNQDSVAFHESKAPKFVKLDIASITSEDEIRKLVEGNYVSVEMMIEAESEINDWRKAMEEAGAAGCVIKPTRKPKEGRAVGVTASLATLEGSIDSFIKAKHAGNVELSKLCMEILSEEVEL